MLPRRNGSAENSDYANINVGHWDACVDSMDGTTRVALAWDLFPGPTAAPAPILLLLFAGWVNRRQVDVIDYLKEDDRQRRRLAVTGKRLGRKALRHFACIARPDTILRW